MNLFQTGDFTLASGAKSTWKIECDALTKEDWDGLAAMLMEFLHRPFGQVLGVPRGGIPLAEALSCYTTDSEAILIVDDVWTTGNSMRKYVDDYFHILGTHKLYRAVIFARNRTPMGVTALFTMPYSF